MSHTLNVFTRGSELATTQTATAVAKLQSAIDQIDKNRYELKTNIVRSIGDRFRNNWLEKINSLSLDERSRKWTLELEQEAQKSKFNIAIHSGKDLPFVIYDDTEYLPILGREDARDIFIPRETRDCDITQLAGGATIGTSSNRRIANLRALRPDLNFKNYVGNVTTRLDPDNMKKHGVDGVILAAAGLKRLGLFEADRMYPLPVEQCLPCGNQGILAMQINKDAPEALREAIQQIQHSDTVLAWHAERSFLEAFMAGCDTAISVYAQPLENGIKLSANVPSLDGSIALRLNGFARCETNDKSSVQIARELGANLAEEAKSYGAAKISDHQS